jgi:hypothetical protein
MSYYAKLLLANRGNAYMARRYARDLIAGSPAPYATAPAHFAQVKAAIVAKCEVMA